MRTLALALLCALTLARPAAAVDVDLAQYPDGNPVPNGSVIGDQWRSIGILFSARTESDTDIDAISENFGTDEQHLFFTPDVVGAIAVFDFVVPGTTTPHDAQTFRIVPYIEAGESAELVALDADGMIVDEDDVVATDTGEVTMSVTGPFRRVEWRTHGNPGIAGKQIVFTLAADPPPPPPPPPPPAATPCATSPITGCRVAAKAALVWTEKKAGNERAAITLRGFAAPTTQADFGNPVSGDTRYAVCVYGASDQRVAEMDVDRAGATCGAKPCWKAKKTKGWQYADPSASANGIARIVAVGGKGEILVVGANKAKKGLTSLPTGVAAALQGASSARVQVVARGASCFEAVLSTVKKADGTLVKAKKP